jgi:hypothetical protein
MGKVDGLGGGKEVGGVGRSSYFLKWVQGWQEKKKKKGWE